MTPFYFAQVPFVPCLKHHGDPHCGHGRPVKFPNPGPSVPEVFLCSEKKMGSSIYTEACRFYWVGITKQNHIVAVQDAIEKMQSQLQWGVSRTTSVHHSYALRNLVLCLCDFLAQVNLVQLWSPHHLAPPW